MLDRQNDMLAFLLLGALVVIFTSLVLAQDSKLDLKIEDVMTAQELNDTGVAGLTALQRRALNTWLTRYTEKVIRVVADGNARKTSPGKPGRSADCVPAVESTIAGDFNGWEGETVFKLDNGQIWEQSEYDYTYSYSYRPGVTIYQTNAGCRMKVDDEDETILVRRIR